MQIEAKLKQMGIELPDFGGKTYYGANYGKMKPFHRVGNLLVLSGHVPDLPDGKPLHPGRVGAEVTVYYDPDDPAMAVLERDRPGSAFMAGVALIGMGLAVAAARWLLRRRPLAAG